MEPSQFECSKEHPSDILRVMRHFQEQFPSKAIWLAGGAPRNWDNGKDARDFDLYVFGDLTKQDLKLFLPGSFTLLLLDKGHHNYPDDYIKRVIRAKSRKTTFEFIVVDTNYLLGNPEDSNIVSLLNTFNCDFCKVAMDFEGNYLRTPEYKTDKMNNTMTYDFRNLSTYRRRRNVDHHIPKMLDYFPNRDLHIIQGGSS